MGLVSYNLNKEVVSETRPHVMSARKCMQIEVKIDECE